MKKAIIIFSLIIAVFSVSAAAQMEKEKVVLPLDQILEADAKHNLNVAWQYFKLKKAYQAALMRTEETLAAHPTFSKIDEILYISGMSSYYLANGKGKQKINPEMLNDDEKERFAPKRLIEDAVAFLGTLVEEHPDSKYRKKAEKYLKLIKPEK